MNGLKCSGKGFQRQNDAVYSRNQTDQRVDVHMYVSQGRLLEGDFWREISGGKFQGAFWRELPEGRVT